MASNTSSNSMEPSGSWSKDAIKSLRLRLGWSQADLARRLSCASTDVELWENGSRSPAAQFMNELFLISKQADVCSHEVAASPRAETLCDQKALGQIEFSEIKEEIE